LGLGDKLKKKYLVWACVVPLFFWFTVPFLIRYPIFVFSKTIPACEIDISDPLCAGVIAAFGQSGDIFGIVSSLFSGLALFAVAITLWNDYSVRRTSVKPLLVCTIDENKQLAFDEPHHTVPRSVRFRVSVAVKAANETAMNVMAHAHLEVGDLRLDLDKRYVQTPLLVSQQEVLEFSKRLNEAEIAQLINQVNQGHSLMLNLRARCDSMEELSWITQVTYKLTFRNSDVEMIRKLQHDEAKLLEAWQGGAAVDLLYEIKPGSWWHQREI
jgi:hypothetical protein